MKFLIPILGSVAYNFLTAWFAMVFLGIAHGCDHRVPAFGYWVVFFLSLAIMWANAELENRIDV